MAYSVRLSELRDMSEKERAERLSQLVQATREPADGGLEELNARISEYEDRYEISSEDLMKEIYQGTRAETAEIADWLLLLYVRERANGNGYRAG